MERWSDTDPPPEYEEEHTPSRASTASKLDQRTSTKGKGGGKGVKGSGGGKGGKGSRRDWNQHDDRADAPSVIIYHSSDATSEFTADTDWRKGRQQTFAKELNDPNEPFAVFDNRRPISSRGGRKVISGNQSNYDQEGEEARTQRPKARGKLNTELLNAVNQVGGSRERGSARSAQPRAVPIPEPVRTRTRQQAEGKGSPANQEANFTVQVSLENGKRNITMKAPVEWHYKDPLGNLAGPCKPAQLLEAYESKQFSEKLKVSADGGNSFMELGAALKSLRAQAGGKAAQAERKVSSGGMASDRIQVTIPGAAPQGKREVVTTREAGGGRKVSAMEAKRQAEIEENNKKRLEANTTRLNSVRTVPPKEDSPRPDPSAKAPAAQGEKGRGEKGKGRKGGGAKGEADVASPRLSKAEKVAAAHQEFGSKLRGKSDVQEQIREATRRRAEAAEAKKKHEGGGAAPEHSTPTEEEVTVAASAHLFGGPDSWAYIDPTGTIQQPFTSSDMLNWFRLGYLQDRTLPVVRIPKSGKLPLPDAFIPLGAQLDHARTAITSASAASAAIGAAKPAKDKLRSKSSKAALGGSAAGPAEGSAGSAEGSAGPAEEAAAEPAAAEASEPPAASPAAPDTPAAPETEAAAKEEPAEGEAQGEAEVGAAAEGAGHSGAPASSTAEAEAGSAGESAAAPEDEAAAEAAAEAEEDDDEFEDAKEDQGSVASDGDAGEGEASTASGAGAAPAEPALENRPSPNKPGPTCLNPMMGEGSEGGEEPEPGAEPAEETAAEPAEPGAGEEKPSEPAEPGAGEEKPSEPAEPGAGEEKPSEPAEPSEEPTEAS